MEVPAELVWLIERLRSTSSRRLRLRLLIEAWQTVRELSPADRLLVARELGFDGAERLVDRIAQGHGGLRSLLGVAAGRLEADAGADLGDLLRGLVDPGTRHETVEHLVDAADAWAAEIAAAQAGDAGEVEASGTEPDDSGGPEHVEVVELEPVARDPAQVQEAERLTATPEAPPPARAATEAALDPGDEREREDSRHSAPVDGHSTGERPAETAQVAAAPSETLGGDVGGTGVGPAGVGAGASASPARELAGELAAEPRINARLRRLRQSAAMLEGTDSADIVVVLKTFPAGWSRRRALQRLLEAGIPEQVADAIELLGLLERPSERLWAVTTLAASRALDETDRETLLAAIESPVVRQRMARRLAR